MLILQKYYICKIETEIKRKSALKLIEKYWSYAPNVCFINYLERFNFLDSSLYFKNNVI